MSIPSSTSKRTFRVGIRSAVKTAEITSATYAGHDYLVVPIVALVGDSVLRPHGSSGPEFVPKEVLAVNPQTWAGRPVIYTHPLNKTADGSANYPEYLESNQYGVVFGSEFNGSNIVVQAYIDPARAKEVGAEKVVEDINSGTIVEVSVGAWVTAVEEKGTSPSGEEYEWRWTSVSSDHLAVGLDGAKGACSVDIGCGGPRSAEEDNRKEGEGERAMKAKETKSTTIADHATTPTTTPATTPTPSLLSRLLSMVGGRTRLDENEADTSGTSDTELRNSLARILRESVVGFDWVESVYQDTSTVVYSTFNNGSHFFQRTYDIGSDGVVTLNDDAEEAKVIMSYVPLQEGEGEEQIPPSMSMKKKGKKMKMPEGVPEMKDKKMPMPAQSSSNSASNSASNDSEPCECKLREKGAATMKAQVKLKAATATPVDPEGVEGDEGEEGEEVEVVEGDPGSEEASAGEKVVARKAAAKASTSTPAPKTLQDWMSMAPPEVQSIVSRSLAQEATRRGNLVTKLSSAQKIYTKEELTKKPTEELEKLLALAAPKESALSTPAAYDFSGARLLYQGPPDASAERDYTPPDPWKMNPTNGANGAN